MAISEDNVRFQTVITKELAAEIGRLAGRMGMSESRMAAMLLEAAVRDEGWIVEAVSSNFAKKLYKAFGIPKGGAKPAKG